LIILFEREVIIIDLKEVKPIAVDVRHPAGVDCFLHRDAMNAAI
jgi:hypothetical protein